MVAKRAYLWPKHAEQDIQIAIAIFLCTRVKVPTIKDRGKLGRMIKSSSNKLQATV